MLPENRPYRMFANAEQIPSVSRPCKPGSSARLDRHGAGA